MDEPIGLVFDFYGIAIKRTSNLKVQFGQHPYDFDEGVMSFMAPNHVTSLKVENSQKPIKQSGWILYVHPDFLWNTPLAKTIKQYAFWDYSLHEALFLSEKEEMTMAVIIENIRQEYHSNIDKFSKKIIISYVEALLNNADRFYHRQFITREKNNHQVLVKMEKWLSDHFCGKNPKSKGLPTVTQVAQSLNMSPKYLSSLLKVLTGQNAQQHIHEKLIERAKEKLSTTNQSISEIAYELGFEHLQSFSKLFKAKTKQSPLEFKASFHQN